jgi:hypothetical protein
MSTGVPASSTCEVETGRTVRLTELDGTNAYGYDAQATPYAEVDPEDGPGASDRRLVACDLTSGVLTRFTSPVGTDLYIADLDRGRLLLNNYSATNPDPRLVDASTGQVTRLTDFDDRGVFPVSMDGAVIVGEQQLESPEWQVQPSLVDLRPGGYGFRVVTSYQLGIAAQRLRPVEIVGWIIVGVVSDDEPFDLPSVWVYDLQGEPGFGAPVPTDVFLGRDATVTAFDGQTLVGYGVRESARRISQPFAWTIGQREITWLPMPDGAIGGIPWAIDQGHVVGKTFGNNREDGKEWHHDTRAIVWDLRSGEYLDLGTGPRELSGTLATETVLTPQSLAVAIQGNVILGYLGEGCAEIGGDYPFYCAAAGFGGTSITWDITDWLTSITT